MNKSVREIRNKKEKLLCKVNDATGVVETEGAHKCKCNQVVPVGHIFEFTREGITSQVIRTPTEFIVREVEF